MKLDSKIYVAGHRGLVGSALCRLLATRGYTNIVTAPSQEIDLRDPEATKWFFSVHNPEYVFLAAAKVGGIAAHAAHSSDFIIDNLRIQNNVLENARIYGVNKLLFFGSACAYPKHAATPIREEALLSGPLEPTNEGYALAKIAGIKLCQSYQREYGCDFISVMPTNLYGPGDNYDLKSSHVLPGMIRRIHEAKKRGGPVKLWGTGTPWREFLYSDDLADAALFLMIDYYDKLPLNVGTGRAVQLNNLAVMVAAAVGYSGDIEWDASVPDGTPNRCLDTEFINSLGWYPTTQLHTGIEKAYADFLSRYET